MAIQQSSPLGHTATRPAGSDGRATWAGRETGRPEPLRLRLLDRVHQAIGTRHYSGGTEKASAHLGKRHIFFHGQPLSLTTRSAITGDQGIA